MILFRTAVLSAALSAVLPTDGIGQTPVVILSDCSECRIRLETVAVLGKAGDSIAPTRYSVVVALDRGGFALAPTNARGSIALYSHKGQFVRTIGRHGEGPGEFRSIRSIGTDRNQTVYVFEPDRVTPLVGEALRPGTPRRIGISMYEAVQLDSVRTVVAGPLRRPEGNQFVHVVDGSSILHSFSPETPPRGSSFWRGVRRLAPSRNGIWVAHANQYLIELWSDRGSLVKVMKRDVSWFEPWHTSPEGENFSTRPQPNIVSIRETEDGLLVVLIHVADAKWKPIVRSSGAVNLDDIDMHSIFDTVIEVINPNTATVVGQARFDQFLTTVSNRPWIVHVQENRDGSEALVVRRLVVSQSSPNR